MSAQVKGSITDEDRAFVETWESVIPGSYVIYKLDPRGDEKFEVVKGGRRFMLTSEERILNHERVANEADDPFLNGAFRPVIVPDSVTVESNPNALSDKEIHKVFKSSDLAWSEWMKTIDSPATLRRMMDLAESADISLKRYKDLEQRHREVNPRLRVTTSDKHLQQFLPDHRPAGDQPSGTGASTARDGAGNPRRQGGRSSDYR